MPELPSPTETEIAQTAFLVWLDAGKPEGQAEAHWHHARALLADRARGDTPNAAPRRRRIAEASPDGEAAKPRKSGAKPRPAAGE